MMSCPRSASALATFGPRLLWAALSHPRPPRADALSLKMTSAHLPTPPVRTSQLGCGGVLLLLCGILWCATAQTQGQLEGAWTPMSSGRILALFGVATMANGRTSSAVLLSLLLCHLPAAAGQGGDDPCRRACGRENTCADFNRSFTCDILSRGLGCDCAGCCLGALSPHTPPSPPSPPLPLSPPSSPPSPPVLPPPPSPPPALPLLRSLVLVTSDSWASEVSWELECGGLGAPITGSSPYEKTHAVPLGAPCTLTMRDSYADGCMPISGPRTQGTSR